MRRLPSRIKTPSIMLREPTTGMRRSGEKPSLKRKMRE